ncbi:MAG: caspase family protein [Nostocales cyanobacterium 94392]|nr:caspase family protein [Nostocales cyanobacterium 94392]
MANIYALLVGINEYHPQSGVGSLTGCVNDIEAIETYLRERITTDNKWELVENSVVDWKLTNELATRQAVIDGFEKHLSQAQSEDVVLFYYAGHGSYEPPSEVFREQERDGKIETLVCYDSRTSGVPDLADKELNYLIEQVAKNNPHILIILDSCHSGTATRDPDVVERQTNTSGNARDLQDFLFPQEWVKHRLSNSYQRPRHVLISACRDFQTAKETGLNNQRRGAFSYFLTEALQRTNGSLSYANLVQDINALITGKVQNQSPQIEAQSDDLIQTFLGGAAGKGINYFTLIYDNQTHHNWVIKGGILHGIRPTSEGKTRIVIFPQGTEFEQLEKTDNAICEATLNQVFTEVSIVEIEGNTSQLSSDKPYWAVVTEVPLPLLKVYFQGDITGIELARTKLALINAGKPSLYVRETESLTDADYYLEAVKGQFWIKQTTDKKPLVAPVPEVRNTEESNYTGKDAEIIIKRLEHIARWKNILELKNSPTSKIKSSDVEMEIIVTSGDKKYSSKTETSALLGEYLWKDNNSQEPEAKIKITNKSQQELYFQVIELDGNYAINVSYFFQERGSIPLPSGKVAEGEAIDLEIPREYLNNGINEYDTIYKLIVSDREFDPSLLRQEGLDSPPPTNRSTDLSGTLNRLMDNVYSRGGKPKKDKYIDNWMTEEVKVTLIKPPGGVEIKDSVSTNLLPGVELQSHPNLKGKFSINPLPPSSRDVNSNLIPPILLPEQTVLLRDGKRQPESYNFNMTRGGGGNLSLLEIVDIENHESVTPENPIKLVVDKPLSSDEYILPIAYDGEFFLPLGKANTVNGKTEITLERLPEPTVDSRSLQGSIKILFHKVFYETAGKQLGMNFPYPLLRIANISDSGKIHYSVNANEIKTKIAAANKILLYIHGIIGDTESLLSSLQSARLGDKYDLVLAFDYENLKTTIQENGKLLKQRLEEFGISANHGKQLDIVAHSMGGLVSRVFIEEEGGNQIVNHLIMLGTPNGGSPWAKIQDWAFTALGVGLNQLSSVAWGTNIIAALLAFLEANDNALDQMKIQSDFIQSIAKNPDPKVKYTIIAGDRTIRPEALEVVGGNSSKIQRMMGKLFASAVDNVVNMAFLKQPNDIAVTLESIKSVSLERNPQPIIISPVGCDHLTYFTSQAGLDALVQALGDDL